MGLNSIIKFKKKTPDWWILTLLPLLLILSVSVISYFTNGIYTALSAFIEQILTFSFVLSSTDLALRSKIVKEDKRSRLPPIIPLILAFIIFIIYVALIDTITARFSKDVIYCVFVLITIIIGYASIILYNNNPYSDPFEPNPVEEKIGQEEADMKRFEFGDKQ
ncbi:MAG: hypothetical protein V1866_01020 [archaeon]